MEATALRMAVQSSETKGGWILAGLLGSMLVLAGCGYEKRVEPVLVANNRLGRMVIAVAPAMNLSGAADFDPNRFADVMASELSYVQDVSVVPVSRVLGVLNAQGADGIESPQHALELVELLGADALLVFAVTEYDPYDPPSIGISAQLYGAQPGPGGGTVDPVALSRQAGSTSAAAAVSRGPILAQTQRVFDASHASVVRELRDFARHRSAGDSPYGWRKFVVSQRDYMRFCCYATIQTLVSGRDDPVLAAAGRER